MGKTDEDRISSDIAHHVWMIATSIRELGASVEREQQIARNISTSVRIALNALEQVTM